MTVHLPVVQGTTCWYEQMTRDVKCQREACKQWFDHEDGNNCVLITAARHTDGMTLQQIGDVFDLTRMRILQIVQKVIALINDEVPLPDMRKCHRMAKTLEELGRHDDERFDERQARIAARQALLPKAGEVWQFNVIDDRDKRFRRFNGQCGTIVTDAKVSCAFIRLPDRDKPFYVNVRALVKAVP